MTDKKTTTIIQDKRQTRATIPKVFTEIKQITKEDSVEWKLNRGILTGTLIKSQSSKAKGHKTNSSCVADGSTGSKDSE